MNRILAVYLAMLIAGPSTGQQIDATVSMPTSPACGDSVKILVSGWLPCANYRFDSTSLKIGATTIDIGFYYSIGMICLPVITQFKHTVFAGIVGSTLSGNTTYFVYSAVYDNLVMDDQDTVKVGTGSCCPAKAAFTPSSTKVCSGSIVNFTNYSTGGISWWWSENGTVFATSFHTSRTFSTPGKYTITLGTTDGTCSDSTSVIIDVIGPPAAAPFSTVKNNRDVQFFDQSTGNTDATYLWDFGDFTTDTSRNPLHTYADTGTYWVCLTISNPCGTDSTCSLVKVSCLFPKAKFSYAISGLTVAFTDSSAGATAWYWTFGDGTFSAMRNPSVTYAQQDTFTVCLAASNDCGADTVCQTIDLGVGINQAGLSNNINIFPNPVLSGNSITISGIPAASDRIIIFNCTGTAAEAIVPYRKGTVTWNNALSGGLYFLAVLNSVNPPVYQKLVVFE